MKTLKFHRRLYGWGRFKWKFFVTNLLKIIIITLIVTVFLAINIDTVLYIRSLVWSPPIVRHVHMQDDLQRLPMMSIAKHFYNESSLALDRTEANILYKRVKILCIVPTIQSHVDSGRVDIINSTWGRRCNKVIYLLCPTKYRPEFINTCMYEESKKFLLDKVMFALYHVYHYYINDFDWILKADDDTYVVMENLRLLLSHYRSDQPGYLGYQFRTFLMQGYNSGGAGFVISRAGLKQAMEMGFNKGLCAISGEVEDLEIGKCMEISNVPVLNSLDKYERQTFHTDDYMRHITGAYPAWLIIYTRQSTAGGAECCSQFVISFHHLDTYSIIILHHLLYRTSVYGINTPKLLPEMFHAKKVQKLRRFVVPVQY